MRVPPPPPGALRTVTIRRKIALAEVELEAIKTPNQIRPLNQTLASP